MSAGGRRASFRLTATQELVAQTIVCEPGRAAAAWRSVRPSLDLDVMEQGSYFLLPLLSKRLSELELQDPDLARLKGVYKRTWYRNQLLLDELQRPLAELEEEGVPLLAYGAFSLATSAYGELGLRWIPYAEVVTKPDLVERAGVVLERLGFDRAEGTQRHALQPTPYVNAGGQVLVVAGAPPLDLLAPGALSAAAVEIWERTLELQVGSQTLRRLDPTDEFLLICASGAKPSGRPTPVWVVDAVTLLPFVDWDRANAQMQRTRLTLLFRDALHYLVESFDAEVPAGALAALDAVPTTRREAITRRLIARTGGLAGGLPGTLADYLRTSSDRGLVRVVAGLPGFLRRTWGLDHAWQLPGRAVTKTLALATRRSG